jgi:hypothetical protein
MTETLNLPENIEPYFEDGAENLSDISDDTNGPMSNAYPIDQSLQHVASTLS